MGGLGATSVGATSVGATSVGETAVGGTAVGNTVGAPGGDETSTFASAPTIIVMPPAAKSPAEKNRFQAMLSSARKESAPTRGYVAPRPAAKPPVLPPPRRGGAPARRQDPLWLRYRWPALGIGVALLIGIVVGLVFVFGRGIGAAGQLLTITKPTGGTLSATGIRCGTRGTDCSVRRPNGDPIELTPQPDPGFTFAGYSGDCAPGGRTIMSGPRTCGATFVKEVVDGNAAVPMQILTIEPIPTGGTLEGVDILCGTKGSICSAKHPDGVPVELHPTADPGFTFMGFKGDCVPLGHTQMTGPRSCSATFSPTEVVSAAPPIKATPAAAPRGRGATTPTPTAPATVTGDPAAPPPNPAPASIRPPTKIIDQTVATAKPVAPPPTDEEFAKGKIQELLKDYCAAEEALDPDAVKKLYPSANIEAFKVQLNKSKYRSVQCKFGDPVVYQTLDAPGGKAVIQVPLKRVYEHTILTEKPQVNELMATLTLARPATRTQWLIQKAEFKALVKDPVK